MKSIDIGCGERPQLGFDTYTDVYEPKVEIPGNFVLCPLEDMPFINKQFEYAYCHHVVEHCTDPDKACFEMIRIAEKGDLWFPSPQIEILRGRREHNWLVFVDNNRLLFIRKRFSSYNNKSPCLREQKFSWIGEFQWTVVW